MIFFVRSASTRDLEKLVTLMGSDRAGLAAKLAAPGSEFVVADDGKQLGGMGYAALAADQPDTVLLHQIYVHPDFQRQGIGKDMFAELETCFPDATRMRVTVEHDSQAAIAFFQRLGFTKTGKDGNEALIFEKGLQSLIEEFFPKFG